MSYAKTIALLRDDNYSHLQPEQHIPLVAKVGRGINVHLKNIFFAMMATSAVTLVGFAGAKTGAFAETYKVATNVKQNFSEKITEAMEKKGPANEKLAEALPEYTAAFYGDTMYYGQNPQVDMVADTATTTRGFRDGLTEVLGDTLSHQDIYMKTYGAKLDSAYRLRVAEAAPDTVWSRQLLYPGTGSISSWKDAIVTAEFDEQRGRRKHNGLDLRADAMDRLRAPIDGVVKESYLSGAPGGGSVLIEAEDGLRIQFYHVTDRKYRGRNLNVPIKAGESFGKVARSYSLDAGFCVKHIHIEVQAKAETLGGEDVAKAFNLRKNKDGYYLLDGTETIFSDGRVTLVKQPEKPLNEYVYRLAQEEGTTIWNIQEKVKDRNLAERYKDRGKLARRGQQIERQAIRSADGFVREVYRAADAPSQDRYAADLLAKRFEVADRIASAYGVNGDDGTLLAANKAPDVSSAVSQWAYTSGNTVRYDRDGTPRYSRVSKVMLYDMVMANERTKTASRILGGGAEERIAHGLSTLSADHENTSRNPKMRNGSGSGASGHYQFMAGTLASMQRKHGIRMPSYKDWDTEKGIKAQTDLAVAYLIDNIKEAEKVDKAFQKKHGVPLYNTVYYDGHKLTHVSYLDVALASWAGPDNVNPKMVAARETALRQGRPYPTCDITHHSRRYGAQPFTKYLSIAMPTAEELRAEREARTIVEGNTQWAAQYRSRQTTQRYASNSRASGTSSSPSATREARRELAVNKETITAPPRPEMAALNVQVAMDLAEQFRRNVSSSAVPDSLQIGKRTMTVAGF